MHWKGDFPIKWASSPIEYGTNSYVFRSEHSSESHKRLYEAVRYKNQQAVMECGCDAKTVERRGAV
jgi:hypothetical protein